ncbi:MAG: hypothetical protein Q9M10_07900 [Mariprofundaceae bacterium]|nr:hypothetical protein [Mariprofundaceae bacterium]
MMKLKKILGVAVFAACLSASPVYASDQDGYQTLHVPDKPFEESYFTGNKMHMYLGLGSIIAAGITGLTAPEGPEGVAVTPATQTNAQNTTHAYAATAAAALGGAAIVSGLLLHFDDIETDVMDPDTLHMVLTILGTAGYVYAISKAPKVTGTGTNGHPAAGIAGAALMATGIYFEW